MTIAMQAVTKALQAAAEAETMYRVANGEPSYCGFAWVEVRVTRVNSQEAKDLIAAGLELSYKPKCLTLRNPGRSGTQSLDVKEAGAQAAAAVLTSFGYKAYPCSRAD